MRVSPSLKLRRTGNNVFTLVAAIGISLSAGAIGSIFTASAIPTWYAGLIKPALNPPSWVFGPTWTTLYVLMGIAAWLVWKQHSNIIPPSHKATDGQDPPSHKATDGQGKNVGMLRIWKVSIATFFIQLFLNAIWSIIFFGLQSPGWALVNIVLLWFAIVWTMFVFYKISRPAAYLLVPYILWVSFAMYLNYAIWTLN